MEQIDKNLTHIARLMGDVCGCQSVGVWACICGKIELRYGSDFTQGMINVAYSAWLDQRRALEAGTRVAMGGYNLVPILSPHQDLVGIFATAGPLPQDEASEQFFSLSLRRLARYVQEPAPAPQHDILAVPIDKLAHPGGPEELTRLGYRALLTRHGWNVKLVASLLGIPRATFSARMRALDILRPQPSTKARDGRRTATSLQGALRALLWPRASTDEEPA